MNRETPASSWFDAGSQQNTVTVNEEVREFARIWQGFMTARFALGLLLLALQATLYALGTSHDKWLTVICLAYLASTLSTGLFGTPRLLGNTFNRPWLRLVGLDVLAFSCMQMLQGSTINYTPLFALPILLASVLGSLQLALGTAAGVTVLLLGSTVWTYSDTGANETTFLVQAALSSVGYFAMALLSNQLANRLARAGLRARLSQVAANVQRQVNALVIESLPDGVLIVDNKGNIRAANPAAADMLTNANAHPGELSNLHAAAAWAPLLNLTRHSLEFGKPQEADIAIRHEGHGPRRVRVRTRLTDPQEIGGEHLCVLFLQDQRELEARVRTEKLASMGRMSTAVAHEIRNPLAAISQANALLDEDLSDPRQKRLTRMVSENVQRLSRIVDDILNASRVQPQHTGTRPLSISLNTATQQICNEWARQNRCETRVETRIDASPLQVTFEGDHLRRVLVNLLDNALRFANECNGGIQVLTTLSSDGVAKLSVWSAGPPMDHTVEQHLFEPFFSSTSRSSGLGLYICRELCTGHGAQITYLRNVHLLQGQPTEGNEFQVVFEHSGAHATA
jgi:two-component system sensor histidine kinase PilS (NtrC family)